ncbi:MAG: GGDEF domain-containing protein [Acholeplasmatales bacterium]|jgi:diguanylate cyclase (GGDEF)-like protein|nr:GGDEF domain-containing protein [Acholeplasmatales bacterium]
MEGSDALSEINRLISGFLKGSYQQLDTSLFPNEYLDVVNSLNKLIFYVKEVYDFALELGKGNFDCDTPSRGNFLSFSLKDLYSKLNHLCWQSSEIARGSFDQSLDYMGDLSENFNNMIVAIKKREDSLRNSIIEIEKQKEAISVSYDAIMHIFEKMNEFIIVYKENEIFFSNKAFNDIHGNNKELNNLLKYILSLNAEKEQQEYYDYSSKKYFQVTVSSIYWKEVKNAFIATITDITKEKLSTQNLEKSAFQDNLTGLRNRQALMKDMKEVYDTIYPITFVFIDMDKLKFINDNKGHLFGDSYLRGFAKNISRLIGKKNTVYRLGGDEFLITFLGKSEALSKKTMLKIVEDFKVINANDEYFDYEFSYGLYTVTASNHLTLDEVIARADSLMYEQKKLKKRGV